MGKVKEFFKKYKYEIIGASIAAAGGTAVYFIGKHDGINIGMKNSAEKIVEKLATSDDYVLMKSEAFDTAIQNAQNNGMDCFEGWMGRFVPEAQKLCREFAAMHTSDEYAVVFPDVTVDLLTGTLEEK